MTAQDQPQEESHSPSVWSTLREGKLSVNVRYRFEGFDRDGPPFTATSYASTVRLSVGYETPSFRKNFGSNPDRVDANYYLGELGPGWRGLGVKAGYAFLSGRSATDLLTTPLAPPFNGWTDLFITNPVKGNVSGLEARYLSASGPVRFLGGTLATVIFYDYHSDNLHIHYGRELDSAMSYKFKRFHNRWEIGWRFGRYWAEQLFTNALRTSVYTSFTM